MGMRLIISILLSLIVAVGASGQDRYERLAERAQRSFQWKEWSSAAAMYELMLKDRPQELQSYAHAIVANQMTSDTTATVDLMQRAMANGLGLGEVLEAVRTIDFSIYEGDRYGRYLYQLHGAMPWMRRALDHQLLDYYTMRNDGPKIVEFARAMLAGLPESTDYLASLAKGQLLSGQEDEAVATWRKIIELNPINYNALLELGNYYAIKGHKAEAIELLQRAQDLRPTPFVADLLEKLAR